MEKLLEDASIKLSLLASNIAGVSARQMLTALVDGERDPAVLADMARSKMRRKIPDPVEALICRFDDHHAMLPGAMLTTLIVLGPSSHDRVICSYHKAWPSRDGLGAVLATSLDSLVPHHFTAASVLRGGQDAELRSLR